MLAVRFVIAYADSHAAWERRTVILCSPCPKAGRGLQPRPERLKTLMIDKT